MAICRPRTLRFSSSGSARISRPFSRTSPDVTLAPGAGRAIRAEARVDLPQPDSPTIPITSPARATRLAPRSACKGP